MSMEWVRISGQNAETVWEFLKQNFEGPVWSMDPSGGWSNYPIQTRENKHKGVVFNPVYLGCAFWENGRAKQFDEKAMTLLAILDPSIEYVGEMGKYTK